MSNEISRNFPHPLVPAKAGTQPHWITACAGMSGAKPMHRIQRRTP